MKKRLRKKYHIGEFTEFGFEVIIPEAYMTDGSLDDLIEFVESRGLGIGGGAGGAYVTGLGCTKGCHPKRLSCTEDDRVAFIEFCRSRGWPSDVRPLTDSDYDYMNEGKSQPGRIHPRAHR